MGTFEPESPIFFLMVNLPWVSCEDFPQQTNPMNTDYTILWYNTTVDGRNPAPVDRWFTSLFIGFQPSFWWCRISSIRWMLRTQMAGEHGHPLLLGTTGEVWASPWSWGVETWKPRWKRCGYGSIPINTIFNGMNIHLSAILMFTRGTRFWHTAMWKVMFRIWMFGFKDDTD